VAVFEVSDTGLGIPGEDLPRIFDKFYRVQANSKIAKGTGLGLTLVKHIIETVHDGRIAVTSEVGKGSTFSFELPLLN
jgi:two-component system phosphate regulon sensor histidine kinase PhoR